jgi:sulfite reductase (NADPH) flavoprotein alpha-component
MAADVEKALLEIISSEGKMDAAAAKTYLKKLAATSRYVRDVY